MPDHPTHKAIFQTKYPIKFAEKPTAIPTFGLSLSILLNDISIETSDIAEHQEPYNPVWTIDQPVIRLDLRVGIKKDIHPTILLVTSYIQMIQKPRMLSDVLPRLEVTPSSSICLQHPPSTQLS